MAKSVISVFAAALALAAISPAWAQNPQEEAILRQNCTSDYMRLCNMYDPDSPQVEQCFQAKMAQLSPNCRGAITAFSKKNPTGRRH